MRTPLLLVLLLLPAASALQFLAPTDGQTYTGATAVTFVWDEENVTFAITGGEPQHINGTNTTITLSVGLHTATISKDNSTATTSVIVNNQPTQTVTVSTDKQQYEAGESARIRIGASVPAQLNMTIQRNNQVVDTYTVNVQSQTDFLYPLTAVGTYSVLVTGQGSSATTAFTALNTTLGVSIGGATAATAGRIAAFTSSVTGGMQPYTYFWQFSDNTTSSQANADHVFAEPGNYTISLLVQDSGGKQASAARSISVTEQLYELEVLVMSPQRKLIKGATVSINGPAGGKSDLTSSFGEVTFERLAAGNYTVNATYNGTNATYRNTTTLALTEDEDIIITLPLPEEAPASAPSAPVATTPAASLASTSANNTNTSATSAAEQVLAQRTMKAADDAAEQYRQVARAKLKSHQEGVLRSEEKHQLLRDLGMLPLYDEAAKSIDKATTEEEMAEILKTVPQEVTILSKDTLVEQFTAEELKDAIETYLEDKDITGKELREQYRYNIGHALENTTFTLKRTVVRVVIPANKGLAVHTVFMRSIQAPAGTAFIEYLPEGVTIDDITSESVYEDVGDAVQFTDSSYTYTVAGEVPLQAAVLPVPQQLVPVPKLLGFVTVKLQPSSFARGPLYAIILGVLIAAGVAGNVLARKRTSSAGPFTELAELTISLFEQGNHAAAMKYIKEVETIHAALPQKERQETADILHFIQETAAVHSFRSAADHVTNLINLNDATGLPAAYERLVQQYETLPAGRKTQEESRFEQAQSALERHLSSQEGEQA